MEDQSTTRPPFFNGNDYPYWKTRMRVFLQALDYELWEIVCDGSFIPRKNVLSELDKKNMTLNSKAMNALFCALDKKEFHRVSNCSNAYEI